VCRSRDPVDLRLASGQRVECWLHGPDDQVPEGGRAPLEREEISVADEA
jgi:peptide/nickel transport system ATP-binding protein